MTSHLYDLASTEGLPPDREKALNIALNKISGEWDELKLTEILLELEDHRRYRTEASDCNLGFLGEALHLCSQISVVEMAIRE